MRRWIIIIAVTAAVTFAACKLYYPFSPAGLQARNMQVAEAFIPIVRAAISSDRRFDRVLLFTYTGQGGSLGIRGEVRSGDLAELKRRVEATSPPVAVAWLVQE